MEALAKAGAPWPAAVAVSGGGDSIALMHLLAHWAKRAGVTPPVVVTVDHGLRAESAKDARKVARWASAAGLKAKVLRWAGEKPSSDIEASARHARYRLMGEWARKNRVAALYVGHTRDDQAETFLLRLIRGSGLDGLSAMRALAPWPIAGFDELCVVRPLLALEREHLRSHLSARGIGWLDDAMNEDDRFARVRLRKAWDALEAAGLTRARVADAAAHLSRAREALDTVTLAVLARVCRPVGEGIHVDLPALTAAPREVALRALARMLMTVSGATYRPRFERLERLFDRLAEEKLGGGATLHGCRLAFAPKTGGAFGRGTLIISPETTARQRRGTKNGRSA